MGSLTTTRGIVGGVFLPASVERAAAPRDARALVTSRIRFPRRFAQAFSMREAAST